MKKEKYLQIFRYLEKFSNLKNKPVRDIEKSEILYPEILWLNDIYECDIIENIIRTNFNPEKKDEYWLKIKKPKEPVKPYYAKLSPSLEEWIEPNSLIDSENIPVLKEYIELDNETIYSYNYPEVSEELNQYIEKHWIKDLNDYRHKTDDYNQKYKTYEILNDIYKRLFTLYNKVQQLGEEFELIVGVGLLNLKKENNSGRIFRHILTQKVEIEFDSLKKDSEIMIRPNFEFSSPTLEIESIADISTDLDLQNIAKAELEVKKYIDTQELYSLFCNEDIMLALRKFIVMISADGKFSETIEKPREKCSTPFISFSPALIFRKRNTKSFTALYNQIINNISEEDDDKVSIPSIDDLIGYQVDKQSFTDLHGPENSSQNSPFKDVYFPKEYNEEQLEIIEQAIKHNKVLVQGPPGTGKSHTIANLICHLLAEGNRVLVTAYTKRALEVLKDKLPDNFKSLAVNLLSGDTESIQDLQASVNHINDELSKADFTIYSKNICDLETNLKEIREKKAFANQNLINFKEKDTREIEINRYYSGTLIDIAKSLEDESLKFDWYKDSFNNINDHEIYNNIITFIDLYKKVKLIDSSSFSYIIPNSEYLLSIEQLKEYMELISEFKSYPIEEYHREISCNDFYKLETLASNLKDKYRLANNIKSRINRDIINDFLSNKDLCEHKLKNTQSIINTIKKQNLEQIDRDIEISYNGEKSLKQYKNDAQILLNYLDGGKTLNGMSFTLRKKFLSNEIKERLYFINEVKVNGSPCDTIDEFQKVIRDLELQQDFQHLSQLWEIEYKKGDSYISDISYFENLYYDISMFIDIIKESENLRKEIEVLCDINITPFDLNNISYFIKEIKYNSLKNCIYKYNDIINCASDYLNQENIHPIKNEILNIYKHPDTQTYEEILSTLELITLKNEEYNIFKQLKNKLEYNVPHLIESIISDQFSSFEISEFKRAVHFRHAQNEVKKIMDIDSDDILYDELKQWDLKEKRLIEKLAAQKAWYRVLENLQKNRDLQKNLTAWSMAIQKIGKTGTGPRALKFKKIAQDKMELCKDSVPCWIMPLYKVAETVKPKQGMYDYVIVDEASQLGPDAIFLLYISQNIIIVGDDKQTSPEYIGVDSNIMTHYIKTNLKEIPFADYYGTEFSFFDQAKLFCDRITVLREHFRCMPEIIEFSNKHFYAPYDKCLYSLKQYSEARLEPLKTIFCKNGNIQGTGSRIINEPEAAMIANKIAALILEKQYDNKTFGIITLQGNQQANLIDSLLLKQIGPEEYYKRKIICGNSASFQGDERDIIFLSLVTATNHSRSALTKSEDERRFNVAMSRAKEQVWLFHSVQLEDLSNRDDLRYKLLDHFKNYKSNQPILTSPIERVNTNPPKPFDSWFEVDVYNDIIRKGYSVIPQYKVANGRYIIDLVAIFPDGTKIAIECDGDYWHGAEQYANDIMRQKVLERCGWQFFRIRGCKYYTDRVNSLEALWQMMPDKKCVTIKDKESEVTYSEEIYVSKEEKEELQLFITSNNSDKKEEEQKELIEKDKYLEATSQFILTPWNKRTETATSEPIQQDLFSSLSEEPKIIRYFNLYKSGNYTITKEAFLDADYVIPIKENQTDGYLLQCYNSGHINKVNISSLLNKKLDREYMNGLNIHDSLSYIKIIDSDKIIAMLFNDNGSTKFKAHFTKNIPSRDLLYLQGYKVMYSNYENLKYKVLPLDIKKDISRLIFDSFSALGKPIDNPYYKNEWSVLKEFKKTK